jgi:5-methylcytosine-specific restriction endonuclease McrA
MEDECTAYLRAARDRFGYSRFDRSQKLLNRERLQVQGREKQKSYPWREYARLYKNQNGICGICQNPMTLIKKAQHLEMDHKNPNLTGEAFEAESNRQVTHWKCNREKGSKNLVQQSKKYHRTIMDLNGGSDEQQTSEETEEVS